MCLPHLLLLKHLTKLDLFIKSCVNVRESLRLKVVCNLKAEISRMAQNKEIVCMVRSIGGKVVRSVSVSSVMQSNLYCQRLNRYHNVGFAVAVASPTVNMDVVVLQYVTLQHK